jgi:hypothetical protein
MINLIMRYMIKIYHMIMTLILLFLGIVYFLLELLLFLCMVIYDDQDGCLMLHDLEDVMGVIGIE